MQISETPKIMFWEDFKPLNENATREILSIPLDESDMESMPIVRYDGAITLIDNDIALAEEMPKIMALGSWAFDTETRPAFTKGQHFSVSLLQISDGRRCWVIRLKSLPSLTPIYSILMNPKALKIGLSTNDDLRSLRALMPRFRPIGYTDIQWFVKQAGGVDLSLKKLAARILGVRVSKRQRLTNWEAPALTDAQLRYAATDAWITYLLHCEIRRGNFMRPDLALYVTQKKHCEDTGQPLTTPFPAVTADFVEHVCQRIECDPEYTNWGLPKT